MLKSEILREIGALSRSIHSINDAALRTYGSVSYTHLDVYKRQGLYSTEDDHPMFHAFSPFWIAFTGQISPQRPHPAQQFGSMADLCSGKEMAGHPIRRHWRQPVQSSRSTRWAGRLSSLAAQLP